MEKITTIIFPGQAAKMRDAEKKKSCREKKKSNLKISLTSPVSLFILHEFLRASGRIPTLVPALLIFYFLMNIKVVRDDEKLRTLERL